ncbi:hypothetical protein ZIOFF_032443 [Zingiber officinale]|uniref:HECT domain-containing protein n=1 Tax=Zingiber officinale TaxID=94328 RepID=A0A8J5GIB7_ZINOF|nr:hypothetical protein ZIOFF_032443 [Zingiber officinale]
MRKSAYYQPLLEKVRKKLLGWNIARLSFGGRLVLIQSVLSSIVMYLVQIAWKDVCKPKLEGGLGERKLLDVASVVALRLWFRFREHNTPWAWYLIKQYCGKESPIVVSIKSNASPWWKRLIKSRAVVETPIEWRLGWVQCELEVVLEAEVVAAVISSTLLPDEIDKLTWKRNGRVFGASKGNCSFFNHLVLWKAINDAKHRDIKSETRLISRNVTRYLCAGMTASTIQNKNWKGFRLTASLLGIPVKRVTINVIDVVYWRKPNFGFKLNTDGCAKGNPGLSFYGAIVRDHEGKVIFAWHGLIGMGSNLRAELFGILKGLELCIDKHLFPLWLESDSLVALKILQFSWFCWEIRNMAYRGPMERILGGHEIDRNLLGFEGWDWIVLSENFIIGALAEGRIYNFDDQKVIVHSVPEVVFVNSKLSDKLEQQMRDPLQDEINGSLEVEYAEEVGTGLGHTMEFYTLVSHEFQKAGLGMWKDLCCNIGDSEFVSAPLGLFPCPWSTTTGVLGGIDFSDVIEKFLLLRKRVAKAIRDRRILDIPFSSCFYKIMLEQELSICDIQSFDPELGMTLLEFQAIVNRKKFVESVSGESHRSPKVLNIESLEEYVALVVDATIGSGIASQVDAFKSGFNEVFPLKALQIFTKDELEELLCGEQDSWDGCSFTELVDHIKFDHGYTASSPTVNAKIIQEFDCDQRRAFLQFAHGGLAALNPKLTVVRKRGSCDADLDLPSVMTCANYLKLPLSSTKGMLIPTVTFRFWFSL